jgi:CysZ protein
MLDAVFKALGQMFSPPFRMVLLKSMGLAVLVLTAALFTGAIMLMPAATALVAGFFADDIAERVERSHYPADPPGVTVPLWPAAIDGIETALLAVAVYLCALPFFLFAGIGAVMFFIATAWLLGRQYFDLAAMRFHPVAEAKALRRRHHATVFTAGLFIAGFVSIPVINLATPLFGTALMVHVHKKMIKRYV